MNLGWSCMSWRQPATPRTHTTARPSSATRNCAGVLIRHLRNFVGMKTFEKLPRVQQAELGVLSFNAQEKLVAAGAGKARHIKDRMIRLRQSVQREHAENRSQRSAEHRAFKRHRNKRRPPVERLAAHIEGIIHGRNPELKRVS